MISCDNNGINTQTLNGEKKTSTSTSSRPRGGNGTWNKYQKYYSKIQNSNLLLFVVRRLDRLRIIHSVYTQKLILLQRERAFSGYINKFLILFSASPVF